MQENDKDEQAENPEKTTTLQVVKFAGVSMKLQQKDSLLMQQKILDEFANYHGVQIVASWRDVKSTRPSAG